MTSDDAKKFRAKAIYQAYQMGFGQDAEDLAQDVIVRMLSNSYRSLVRHTLIDCVRLKYGREGQKILNASDEMPEDEHEPWGQVDSRIDVLPLLNRLDKRSYDIVQAYFVSGEYLQDIADKHGMCETRVCQIIKSALAIMKKRRRYK